MDRRPPRCPHCGFWLDFAQQRVPRYGEEVLCALSQIPIIGLLFAPFHIIAAWRGGREHWRSCDYHCYRCRRHVRRGSERRAE